jgi:hypothetical protein
MGQVIGAQVGPQAVFFVQNHHFEQLVVFTYTVLVMGMPSHFPVYCWLDTVPN